MSAIKLLWPKGEHRKLSIQERQMLLDETRASRPGGPFWVFAFGSLMWNPEFEYAVSEIAILTGWERKFHIWTTIARGTPERPGLGLCLEEGDGDCKGIAYQLIPENEERDWLALWSREMNSGVYKAMWADIETQNSGCVRALTFVADLDHQQYAGPLPVHVMAEIMAEARGRYGRCRDYLASTVEELNKLGVADPHLSKLLELVDLQ